MPENRCPNQFFQCVPKRRYKGSPGGNKHKKNIYRNKYGYKCKQNEVVKRKLRKGVGSHNKSIIMLYFFKFVMFVL